MNARHRAYIDGVSLNFIFRSTFGIVAFRLVVIREAEYRRNIFNTDATADAFVLIDPRFSGHFISTFRVIGSPVRQAQMFYNLPIDYIMSFTAVSNTRQLVSLHIVFHMPPGSYRSVSGPLKAPGGLE